MGFDLTNERIQDTYQQLVQVSGSTLVNGTGSAIPFTVPTASYAITASFALNAGDIDTGSLVTNATFNAYTSSNDTAVEGKLETSTFNSYTSSTDTKIDNLTAATSSYLTELPNGVISSSAQVEYDSITGVPSGIVSSSTQTIANIAGGTIAPDTINVSTLSVSGTASVAYLESITGSA